MNRYRRRYKALLNIRRKGPADTVEVHSIVIYVATQESLGILRALFRPNLDEKDYSITEYVFYAGSFNEKTSYGPRGSENFSGHNSKSREIYSKYKVVLDVTDEKSEVVTLKIYFMTALDMETFCSYISDGLRGRIVKYTRFSRPEKGCKWETYDTVIAAEER